MTEAAMKVWRVGIANVPGLREIGRVAAATEDEARAAAKIKYPYEGPPRNRNVGTSQNTWPRIYPDDIITLEVIV